MSDPVILAGSRAAALAANVAQRLSVPARTARVERFPDGESKVELETDVGRRDVFIVQSLSAPVGESALELLLLADAAWRAGAQHVFAVLPYFAYARQDRRTGEGQPLGAKVMARVVDSGRFDRIVAVDLHTAAVAGCFETRVDHLTAAPAIVDALRPRIPRDSIVVSPDLGAVKLAERYARALDLPLAIVHKTRLSGTEVAAQGVVGDVAGRAPVIIDDMISTGGTIVAAAEALRARGCVRPPVVAATHGLFVGPAAERIRALRPASVLVTDSVPRENGAVLGLPLDSVELAPLLAHVIRALHRREPIGALLAQV